MNGHTGWHYWPQTQHKRQNPRGVPSTARVSDYPGWLLFYYSPPAARLRMMEKHFTASTVVLRALETAPEVLLIHHRKLSRWMLPGGHVETTENPVEAAIREVWEETGVSIQLVSFLHHPLPAGDSDWLLPPEYVYQQRIVASSVTATHYHIDCIYLAVARGDAVTRNEAETTGVQWVPLAQLGGWHLFDGTRAVLHEIATKLHRSLPLHYRATSEA